MVLCKHVGCCKICDLWDLSKSKRLHAWSVVVFSRCFRVFPHSRLQTLLLEFCRYQSLYLLHRSIRLASCSKLDVVVQTFGTPRLWFSTSCCVFEKLPCVVSHLHPGETFVFLMHDPISAWVLHTDRMLVIACEVNCHELETIRSTFCSAKEDTRRALKVVHLTCKASEMLWNQYTFEQVLWGNTGTTCTFHFESSPNVWCSIYLSR